MSIFIFATGVVYQYFKDTKFKQFTTSPPAHPPARLLFINTSKIQNSSNSQLMIICNTIIVGLFINTSKIQNSSNSQHSLGFLFAYSCCLSILQRYKIQAIHNMNLNTRNKRVVVYQYFKDTKFKQFTT